MPKSIKELNDKYEEDKRPVKVYKGKQYGYGKKEKRWK